MGMQIGAGSMENSMEVPQKIKNRIFNSIDDDPVIPYDPVIPLLGIYPKKMKTLIWKDIHMPMFIAALFTIAKI